MEDSKRSDLLEDSKTYKVSTGPKGTLHGYIYQLNLLMLFAKRFQKARYQFKLATEMDAAEMFDDLVLEFINPADNTKHGIFLQAKHTQKENEDSTKIKAKDLLTTSESKFSLQKYFRSYQSIKKNNKFKYQTKQYFIIYTNIDFKYNDESQNLKELTPFYFESCNPEIGKFNMKINNGVKESKFYKLVGSHHEVQRKKIVDKLASLFKETTDFHKLAEKLAKHLIEEKPVDLNNSLFKKYRDFLVKEVIDIQNNKLRKKFIDLDSTLSSEAKDFQKVLLTIFKKTCNAMLKKEQSKNNIDRSQKIRKLAEIDQIEFKMSKDYKKMLLMEKNPMLKDPKKLAVEIVSLIEKSHKNKKITINKTNEIFIPEIYKLAGHVLVLSTNDVKTTIFSSKFTDDSKTLTSDIEVFRTNLKIALKKKSIKFDELKDYTFQITDFVTCKESEFNALLATEPVFPSQEVTRVEIEDFINDLIFAVNQPNVDQLGEIIDKEIGKEFNLIDSQLVTQDFTIHMLDWFKAKEGRYLKNEDVDAFFNKSKKRISQFILIGPTSIHIEKMQKKKIVFKLNAVPKLLITFLHQSNRNNRVFHLDIAKTSLILGSIKVIQILKKVTDSQVVDSQVEDSQVEEIQKYYSPQDRLISLDLNTLLSMIDQVLNFFKKKTSKQLLIVECNSEEKIDDNQKLKELIEYFDAPNQNRLILIGPTDNTFIKIFYKDDSELHLKIEDESHFINLTETSQKDMLKRTCNFQGNKIVLNQLFDETVTSITYSINLAELLDNKKIFEIGNPIPSFDGYDKKYFIERIFWEEPEINPNDQHKSVKIKKTLNGLLKQLKENTLKKIMIISDVAGMGKSTILSHLSHEIKKQSPDHWIVKIELSRHTEALKEFKSFTPENDVIDFISYKILKIQEPFEKELFKHLFEKKKVVLLLDAFDEISPKYENTVFNLLEALNNTENQIWVTTRPHLKESLRKNLKGKMDFYNLEPFSQNDQIAFLTKFWTNQFGLQDEVKTKNYAEELLKTLTKSIRDNDFTGIPLQTRILAEAFEAEIKTFHIDENKNEPTFVNKLDILDLYDKFYKAKYDTVSQKGKVVEYETYKITNEYGIKHVYSDLALLMLFPEQESFLKIDKEDLLKLQIARFGIAEIINGKEIQFIHQTFAEYSVAEFFSTALTTNNPKEACNYFITNVLLDDKCQIIRYFIDCFLKKNFKKIAENHLKQYGEQIDKIWKDGTLKDDKKTILHVAAKEGNLETFKFLFKGLKDEYKDTLKSLLEARNNNQLAWHEAAKGGHDEVLEELWKWAKYFKLDPKTLLLEVGSDEETAWAQASKNHHFEILKKLWQWAQDIQQSFILKKNLLLSKDFFFKRNAFHYAVLNGNIKALETFQVWATEIQLDFKNDLLLCKDILVQTAFHLAAFKGHVKVLKILRDWATETFVDFQNDVLLSKCVEKRTIFHMAAWQGHAEVLLILRDWATKSNVDFKKKIMISKDNNKHTAFHLAVWEGHVEVLKILREWAKESDTGFKFGFLSKDEHQQTILHLAVEKGHVEVLKLLRDWTTEADANFMKSFLISKDINGNTAFHLAAWKGQVEVLKILREWAKETDADFKNDLLLSQNVNKQTIFHLAALEGHTEILKIVRDWATSTDADFKNHFMISKDKKKFTAFQLAAFNGHVKVLEILQDWAKETNCDFKNDLLLFKNDNEEIAFHMAAYNGHVEVLKILRNWGMETNCDIKTDFLLSKDKNGNNAFHLAAWKGHVEVLKQLQKWAPETKFDFENDLLFSVNYSKKTSLHLAAKNGHIEVLKILRDWAKKGKADFSKKIIISKAINGVTAFQLAVSAGHVEVLKILRDWATESECDFKNDFLLFKNNNGNTIFSIAACNGHVEVLKMFREWVAETDCDFKNDFLLSKNISGQTAFHLAAYAGKAEVLGTLRDWAKEAEADFMNDFVLSKDFQGKTAFNLAECQRHTEVMILLQFWETNSCILVWK